MSFMQKGQDQQHWERIGNSYNAFWESKAKQELSKKELGFINRYLKENKSQYILDIGVGSGRIIENYLVNSEAKEIYGVDWACSMIEFCSDKFKNNQRVQKLVTCNISNERLPFERKFDFISAIRVLKYNKNWKEIAGKIINSLDNNGVFVFTMPNRNSFLRFTKPETSIHSSSKKELEKLIQGQNGEIIHITSFMKLPDAFYDICNNRLYSVILLRFEQILQKILGDLFLSRIFFIAVKKKINNYN